MIKLIIYYLVLLSVIFIITVAGPSVTVIVVGTVEEKNTWLI